MTGLPDMVLDCTRVSVGTVQRFEVVRRLSGRVRSRDAFGRLGDGSSGELDDAAAPVAPPCAPLPERTSVGSRTSGCVDVHRAIVDGAACLRRDVILGPVPSLARGGWEQDVNRPPLAYSGR
jgi:hypothetical protein